MTLAGGGAVARLYDPRQFGAPCNGSDATAGIQTAVNSALTTGGTVIIPCPMWVAGQVNIGTSGAQGGIRIAGIGAAGLRSAMSTTDKGNVAWPSTTGSAIICNGTAIAACLMINGSAIEIDHINFGNPQPEPPTSGIWNPTFYPWIIGTTGTSGWQQLNIHDVTFTATSQAIDLEGTPDYAVWSGTQIVLDNIWCNACLNTGIRFHRIDNQAMVSRIGFVPSGYFMGRAPLGAYLRANLVGLDIQYAAAPQFHDLNFFATKTAIQLRNDTVFNPGNITLAISAGQFTNVMFNQVCQAITMPNGNGTSIAGGMYLSNVYAWGDQSNLNCSAGKPLFDLRGNDINVSIHQLGVWDADTVIAIGCGTPGAGSCPAGPTGASSLRLDDVDIERYSAFTNGQPAFTAPAGTYVTFGNTNLAAIRAQSGAGPLLGPGPDGTQAFMSAFAIGGGPNGIEGATLLQGGQTTGDTGFVAFFDKNYAEDGYVGGCTLTAPAGCSFASPNGALFLKPAYTVPGSQLASFTSSGGYMLVNLGNLPTSCAGLATGTLVVSGPNLQVCP